MFHGCQVILKKGYRIAYTLTNTCLYSYDTVQHISLQITVQARISKCTSNSIAFFSNYLATVEQN